MKKRIGSLLMALVLALSLVPATVWAADGATEVSTFEELKQAVSDKATDIVVTQDIELTERLTVAAGITIRSQEGSVFTLKRSESFTPASDNTDYRFKLDYGADLTFRNIILDGNKEAGQAKNGFFRVSSTNAKLTLGQGATIQNCSAINGGSAISLVRGSVVMEQGSAIKDCTNTSNGGGIYINRKPDWSQDKDTASLTMNGATISGCSSTGTSADYSQGGAIYAYGRVNLDIKNSTITGNSANSNGGAIYAQSHDSYSGDVTLNLSGTTITGNTSEKLGGGVYFAGTTFTVSGVTNITGNTGKDSSNNVYLAAGKTVSGSGLQEGSQVGISGANIPSTLVTGYDDDSENGYFTADRTDTKLKATNGALELVGKEDHTHCICGRTDCQETGTGHRKITCKGVSSLDLIKDSGSYYLLNDVTLTKTWKPNGGTLCLYGHAIHAAWKTAAIELENTYITFNLTDCGTDGKVTGNITASGSVDEASGVIIGARATFNLYNGSICDNTLYSYQTGLKAGAVEANGTFNMYGGSIKNNQGTGWIGADSNYIGGVLVNSTGKFNLYDGEISGNRSAHDERASGTFNGGAVYVNGGKFTMTGGVIKNNRAGGGNVQGDGGAVYIGAGGKFTMTGGEISGNTASRNGGGMAVVKGTFEMTGDAKISGNKAQMDYRHYEHKGGGVFVGASGTFTMSGNAGVEGNLVRNGYSDSVAQGAGVYVSEGGTFTMSEKSSLKSNTMTSQYQSDAKNLYGGGVFVGGTLNLGGGSIEDNTAVYEGGGLYLDTKGTVNLGTGTITVRNNTSEKTTGHNLYLPGAKKLIAPAAPADGSHITLSLPLARIQKAEGTAVITNTDKDIRNGDSRFAFEAEKIALVRDGDGEDVLARIPAHTHDGITYTPVYSLAEIPSNATGSYYLLQDAKMSGTVTVGANNTVNVCLNGHKSEPIYFKNSGTLNITDCKHDTATPGYITGYSNNSGGSYNIENASGSTLNLTNVTVKEKTGSTFISATDATVNISGCEYYDSKSGFLVASTGSKVTVTDSTFKNNTMRAPTLWYTDQGATTGSFTVKKCTFTGNANNTQNVNYENSRGCAINSGCPGTTLIENCTITKNLSHGDGGGIYLYGKGTATIKNTTVEDNESQWRGGGIAVDSANAPVFTGKVVVKNNKSRISYNAYYQDTTTVVDCNVMIGSGCAITTDSGFKTTSSIGLSAWDVPALVVSGNTSRDGFFADDKDNFVLRPTTSTSGPLLTSGNTGLELWHNGKGHTHCVCGTGENTADSTHTHEKLNWIGVTELKDLPAGNYYLLRSYTYNQWTPTEDYNICLNGGWIGDSSRSDDAIINIKNKNSVAITDCSADNSGRISCIYNSTGYSRGVKVNSGSTFTLWNGQLTDLWAQWPSYSSSTPNGGGVWVNGGTFIMNGGSISAWTASGNGGAVYVGSGKFIMNDGSLSGKALNGSGGAVYVSGGRFVMNGGTVTGKASETEKDNGSRGWAGHGGAVYNDGATVIINGGTITGSSAVEGGGIYADGGTLTIGKANITDNIAAHGGGGIHAYNSALTMDGATVTGNNGGESLGGGIYISEAKGKGTASDPYIPAVIQNATIENNTAKCGGGISTSGPVKISDTTITGNTATTLEKWGGGGLNARIIPQSRYNNGWVFELSGKMNITGNNAEGVVNNLYFPEVTAGTMLPAVTGLTAGSTIGVTTELKPLKDGGTIAPVYITGDATIKDYFTSDEGYEVKLDADKNQLYIIAESSTVTVTLGENMTASGDRKQTVLKNHPIADVTITAADGCYFPEDYAANLSKDGITVTRDSLTQITVSGTPTAEDVTLILPAATAKTTPAAPGGLQGEAPSTWGAVDGKISGTKATMEWATSPNSETWTSCTEGTTTVGGQGTYYVRVKATDISYTSDAAAVTVPKYLRAVSFPAPTLTYTYDGNEHTLLVPGEGYTVSGDTKATDADTYTATVNLNTDRYQWSSTVTDNTISWIISKRAAQAADFAFTAPADLVWDGNPKTASITLNSPYTLGGCQTSLVYKQNGQVVASPTDPGTYQVYLVISGDGNFAPTDGLTADSWTFTITHPADHQWGEWEHNDTQHWRCCTVPGCTDEDRADHETNTPATCATKAVCTVC
ncbi:right-handed parallel beta-helix repeat-containing protein, partial [Vescimonas sp.]|uniref:right-handed parallel beta-helix repeat-containing protein n=1 Tax=Vescimonas sp. TaxID=2892404 RepID=UPI00307B8F2A